MALFACGANNPNHGHALLPAARNYHPLGSCNVACRGRLSSLQRGISNATGALRPFLVRASSKQQHAEVWGYYPKYEIRMSSIQAGEDLFSCNERNRDSANKNHGSLNSNGLLQTKGHRCRGAIPWSYRGRVAWKAEAKACSLCSSLSLIHLR